MSILMDLATISTPLKFLPFPNYLPFKLIDLLSIIFAIIKLLWCSFGVDKILVNKAFNTIKSTI